MMPTIKLCFTASLKGSSENTLTSALCSRTMRVSTLLMRTESCLCATTFNVVAPVVGPVAVIGASGAAFWVPAAATCSQVPWDALEQAWQDSRLPLRLMFALDSIILQLRAARANGFPSSLSLELTSWWPFRTKSILYLNLR